MNIRERNILDNGIKIALNLPHITNGYMCDIINLSQFKEDLTTTLDASFYRSHLYSLINKIPNTLGYTKSNDKRYKYPNLYRHRHSSYSLECTLEKILFLLFLYSDRILEDSHIKLIPGWNLSKGLNDIGIISLSNVDLANLNLDRPLHKKYNKIVITN